LKTVLISAYTCCPNRGSEPGNGWNWLMGYIQNGFTVHCVTSGRYITEIEKFCKENNVNEITFYFIDYNISSLVLKIPLIGDYLHYYLWLFKARPIVKKLVGDYSFTHAHHVTYSSIKFGTPLYNLNLKTVLGPLGGGELPDKSLKKYLGRSYYFEAFKYSIGDFLSIINPTVASSVKSADLILVSNEIAANIIRKNSSLPLINMFDAGLSDNFESDFVQRNLDGVINILWIGRMLPRKGLNLAIEAIFKLPKELDFHFYIVGDGPLKEVSENSIAHYKLKDKTTFLGKVPYDQLRSIFYKSHLLLFPSLIDSCPMQVFESMAYGLPVVTLNHQGMSDQVTQYTGVKVDVKEGATYPESLADGIVSIISNPDLYQKLSYSAYDFGQKQLWSKRIKKFIEEAL
jgi:glycosyltransferase involved in cell wall biosynthesis